MADIVKIAKTAAALAGGVPGRRRRSKSDVGLQTQYFAPETAAYAAEVGELASNCFTAQCQGLDPADFSHWQTVKIRSVRASQSQTGEIMPGDWQRIYLIGPRNDVYLPQGAMLKYAGNTWIVYKDRNIAAVLGSAIVRRCNAVINVLDYYGNIVSIPISYAKMGTLGNATHATENTITSKNYMDCVCQLNEYSAAFSENTRLILGGTAYAMRGLDNFTRAYTDDPDSVHLMTFTIERTEVQPTDNVELQVADYGGFSWRLSVDWNKIMLTGSSQSVSVQSYRNGALAESTDEFPIGYVFESSDDGVAEIDAKGTVTAVGDGNAVITVKLAQNESISESVNIQVVSGGADRVAFTTTVPETLRAGESLVIGARRFADGAATALPVTFVVSGGAKSAYSWQILPAQGGGALSGTSRSGDAYSDILGTESQMLITAYGASEIPVTVTASNGEYSESVTIRLII